MPLSNLGKIHITASQQTNFDAALAALLAIAVAITVNLSPEDRKKYKRINEKNKLLANKTNDYHTTQPLLQSPDVNWTEFDLDYADRKYADTRLTTLAAIAKMLSDFKMVHDYDNYQDALRDYEYTVYKQNTLPGFEKKRKDIQQFFPAAGTTRKVAGRRGRKKAA